MQFFLSCSLSLASFIIKFLEYKSKFLWSSSYIQIVFCQNSTCPFGPLIPSRNAFAAVS